MTTKELYNIMLAAETASDNIFDTYLFLADYAEEYLESVFSKIKPTIYDAYELYCSHKNKGLEILDAVINGDYTKILEQFDLNRLFSQIPEQYQGIILQLLEEYDK
jgi:hypothetical protein